MFDPWSPATELYLDFSNNSFFRSKKKMSFEHLDRKQAQVQRIPEEKQGEKKDVTISLFWLFLWSFILALSHL